MRNSSSMAENTPDDKNPWRHHPLFNAYSKFYEGKDVKRGRILGMIIFIIVLLTVALWFIL